MNKKLTKLFITLACIFRLTQACATEIYPFFLERQDGTLLEGYFSPPSTIGAPIIFAVQGSSCESVLGWHKRMSDRVSALGLGIIVLEKQGVSSKGIDLFVYSQTNCLQNRLEDYIVCLANVHLICPGWEGRPIFWGESEGGVLAAILAGRTPETAAVLLFGVGGGMKPREEVKLASQHRSEKQGAIQDEIDGDMSFLEGQMDLMILDPSPHKQFLCNAYKWWASLLASKEAAASLHQHPLPICLVHGVEDSQIPVVSADLAAAALAKTSALTYFRFKGYGHDLDSPEIWDAVSRWLASVFFGQELSDRVLVVEAALPASALLPNAQPNMPDYIFIRGKDEDNRESNGGGKGEVHGGISGGRDSSGNERALVDAGGSYSSDSGWSVGGSAGVSGSKDRGGNTKGEAHGEVHGKYEF